jgi:hypothetical protein
MTSFAASFSRFEESAVVGGGGAGESLVAVRASSLVSTKEIEQKTQSIDVMRMTTRFGLAKR